MVTRHGLIYGLFLLAIGSFAILQPREAEPLSFDDPDLPVSAVEALREGRFLRASLILREYLGSVKDSSPDAVLLAARAEAGLGEWDRVRQLLDGRPWLDTEGDGFGWNLLGRSQLALGQYARGSASLARYLAVADTGDTKREQGVAEARRAEALQADGKHAEAIAAYDRAAELLPTVADWIRVFSAGAAADAGDTAQVRARLAGLDSALVVEWAWRMPVRALYRAGDTAAAVSAAERAAGRVQSAARRASAWSLLGTLRLEHGDRTGARAAFNRAMTVSPGAAAAVEAARALTEMGGLSAAEQLRTGQVYLRHGNVARGVAGIEAYIASGSASAAEASSLRHDIANAYFRAGEYDRAEKELLRVAGDVSNRRVAADALYTAARAQYRAGRAPAARATLDRVIRDYADQPSAARAAWLSGDLDHDDRRLQRATDYYRQAIRLDPDGTEAALARMRIGGIAWTEGRYEDALREFEEFRSTHRRGSTYQQATFWSGRAYEQMGVTDSARARFAEARRTDPFSYYGGRAAEALGEEIWMRRLEPEPPADGRYDEPVARALGRVDILREIGWEQAATFEMDRVRRHFSAFDGASYTLAEQLNERGFTSQGIALGWEIQRREGAWNRRLLRIVYPFPFRDIIVAEARDRGVDPFLAAALIRQESMFNPRARSPVGALGLMQVMPATGRTLARQLGVSGFEPEMLTRPEVNVHFGMAYLADQLRTYGNRLDAVLAAYNAGPARVTRWREFAEFPDPLLFTERIPYDETRDYVRIVRNNQRLYAALYGDLQ